MSRGAPPVSVVIPTYNRAAFLPEAVSSVLNQTGVDFELIVVDDGSTDESGAYLATLAAIHTGACRPVRVIRLDHTGMPGAVRNAGARDATGRYLAFLDSDDLWLADKLARQLALHGEAPSRAVGDVAPAISHTREVWLRGGRTVSQKSQKHRRTGFVFPDALSKCTIGPSTAMVDRELFLAEGGFREDLDFAEDYELWLRLVWNREVAYLDEPLTVKRAGHGDQLSTRFGAMERIRLEALRSLVDGGVFRDPVAEKLARGELARKCRIYAAGARKHGRPDEADAFERLAARYG